MMGAEQSFADEGQLGQWSRTVRPGQRKTVAGQEQRMSVGGEQRMTVVEAAGQRSQQVRMKPEQIADERQQRLRLLD